MSIVDDGVLVDPASYGRSGPPHEAWTKMRQESPVQYCKPAGFEPFWAITKYTDIIEVSRRPELFANAPGIMILDASRAGQTTEKTFGMRTIIEMDPPDHLKFRRVTSAWFTPRAIARLDEHMAESARSLIDEWMERGECDFANDIAPRHPLRTLTSLLGLPRESEDNILHLTNQLFGSEDPDMQRPDEDRDRGREELGAELFELFSSVLEDRRKEPRDDLVSVIANAEIDGAPMGPMETFGYCLIIFTAGHDTTKNALVGGLRALIEHPAELAKLRRAAELVVPATEEIVRWTNPVNHMRRTAIRDTEIRGQRIREGDALALFYASANRDEDIFDDPFAFRVDRDPNPHIGFGIGEHFCLGANVARRSIQAFVRELAPRIESIELTSAAEQIHSSFIVGMKKLPVRCTLRPAPAISPIGQVG